MADARKLEVTGAAALRSSRCRQRFGWSSRRMPVASITQRTTTDPARSFVGTQSVGDVLLWTSSGACTRTPMATKTSDRHQMGEAVLLSAGDWFHQHFKHRQ